MAQDPPHNDDDTPHELAEAAGRQPPVLTLPRARFDERVTRALAAAQQYGESIALLLVDLDYFSKFNARYGQPAGDAALVSIHRRIVASVGTKDMAARLADDSFAVLCRTNVGRYGSMMAYRLCSRISNGAVEIQGADDAYFFTASIGVALFPGSGASTPVDFMTLAEEALRRAKAAGRNRVVVANEPPYDDD